ncbi:MAG: phosphoribosylglycinamide formyltransferase [Alphaproteobacteria bacterium]|nr:phosphoribosylglycinamide formyltransferase [Alphaproteobacteria bacterium]
MLNVAILISGRGSNMQALVRESQKENAPFRVVCVLSNKADAAGLAWAQEQGIHTVVVPHKDFNKDRQAFEQVINEKLQECGAQLVCLAGFMRLLTPWFVQQWRDRFINIHPSLLPAFPGLDVQQKAIDYGAKLSGCTVHFVREEMDHGPIIAQAAVPVLPEDTAETLAARILKCEHQIYPQAVNWIAQNRVSIINEKVFIADAKAPQSLTNPCAE